MLGSGTQVAAFLFCYRTAVRMGAAGSTHSVRPRACAGHSAYHAAWAATRLPGMPAGGPALSPGGRGGRAGDSRAVLARADPADSERLVAVPLTQDHDPSLANERRRIVAAGGRVERCAAHGVPRLPGRAAGPALAPTFIDKGMSCICPFLLCTSRCLPERAALVTTCICWYFGSGPLRAARAACATSAGCRWGRSACGCRSEASPAWP
jgi:hypothetical protein